MATRLAPCFVGLDKRYVTDVDLTSTTSTGDPEGEVLERHEPPSQAELESLLEGLRGEVELPIPAASAVKIGGERAYKLARRGIAVEMPVRRSQVYALDVITYTGDAVQLGLHVGSGTYVRSIADRARRPLHDAPADRGRARSRIEEADPDRLLPVSEVLSRLPEEALDRVAYGLRAQVLAFEAEVGGGEVRPRCCVEHASGSRPARTTEPRERRARTRRARAEAARGRDRHLRRRPRRPSGRRRRGARRRADADGRDVPSAPARGARLRGRAARRPSSAGSSCWPSSGSRTRSSSSSRPRSPGSIPRSSSRPTCSGSAPRCSCAGESFRFGNGAERRPRAVRAARARDAGRADRPRRLVDGDPAARGCRRGSRGRSAPRPPARGRGSRRLRAMRAAARSAFRPRTSGSSTRSSFPRFGIYAGAALDHRAAISIGLNPHYGGTERRIEAFLLDFDRRPLRAAGDRRALGSPSRRGVVRERGRADRADRRGRRGDARHDAALTAPEAGLTSGGGVIVDSSSNPEGSEHERHSRRHLPRHHRSADRRCMADLHEGRRGRVEMPHPDLQPARPAQDRRSALVVDHPVDHPARGDRHRADRRARPGEELR